MEARFSERMTSEAQIREALGHPRARVLRKVSGALDAHCLAFIARSPFLIIASSDAGGSIDVSPKGDAPGFVRVLDPRTLAIPDRRGNRRADTLHNLVQHPQVGLLFLLPGRGETLRVNGSAQVVRDRWLREVLADAGETPAVALVVSVVEVFFHCPRCALRSKVWDPAQWPRLEGLASYARIRADRGRPAAELEEAQAPEAGRTREHL